MDSKPHRLQNWALFGISLLAFTAYLDATIVNTALPFIQTAFNADILLLQWITNIFTLILSMTMIAVGKIADLWGRKKVFYAGVIIFALGALVAGLSPTMRILIFFRGMQALGASAVCIASAALLSDVFSEHQRVRAIAIYGGVTGFGLMIGPFIGGILIALLDWRWVFWINLPIIAVGFIACSIGLKKITPHKHTTAIDLTGLFLLIGGLGLLMYGILLGAKESWASLLAWIFIASGAASLAVLAIFDEVRTHPLLDLPLFKKPLIALSALSCSLAGVASTVFMFFDPLYLRALRGLPPFLIGLLIACIPAAQACISFVFKPAVERFGVAFLLLFSTASALAAIGLHLLIHEETSLLFLILPFFLLGINWGLSNSGLITAANQTIAPHKIGEALGTVATLWNIVGSIFLALSAAIFYAKEKISSFLPAFHRMVAFNFLFAALIFIFALWIYRISRRKA